MTNKVAILGFGREGRSILKFLRSRELARKTTRICTEDGADLRGKIWILDKNKNIKIPRGVKKHLGKNYLKGLEKFDLIFRSPGIPYNLPDLKRARQKGVIFSSATKLFFDLCLCPIIGVTGTKGKGTTATLLYRILRAANRNVFLAGNIGKPALEILPQVTKKSLVILELSSFQLQDLKKSPQIAAVLDVFPDHLNAHKNFQEYLEAKKSIAKFQTTSNVIFYFANNKYSRQIAQQSPGKKIAVPYTPNSRELENITTNLKIPGEHNVKNALMAATVARYLKCPKAIIANALKNFRGLPHRLELVHSSWFIVQDLKKPRTPNPGLRTRRILVKFYNDSASTNPQTTIAAIKSFPGQNIILIAGGQDKNLDYQPLGKVLKNSPNVKLLILLGENKYKIKKFIVHSSKFRLKIVRNLKTAVKTAYRFAKNLPMMNHEPRTMNREKRIVILFSPGSASFDMFKDYQDRGEQFKKLIKTLNK